MGALSARGAIEAGTAQGVRILAPVPKPKDLTRDPHVPLAGDSPVIGAWRQRMGTDEAKANYKLRAATAECVNGQSRTRYNVQQVRVRGRDQVLCVARWVAITHDLLIWLKHWALPVLAPAGCGA